MDNPLCEGLFLCLTPTVIPIFDRDLSNYQHTPLIPAKAGIQSLWEFGLGLII